MIARFYAWVLPIGPIWLTGDVELQVLLDALLVADRAQHFCP